MITEGWSDHKNSRVLVLHAVNQVQFWLPCRPSSLLGAISERRTSRASPPCLQIIPFVICTNRYSLELLDFYCHIYKAVCKCAIRIRNVICLWHIRYETNSLLYCCIPCFFGGGYIWKCSGVIPALKSIITPGNAQETIWIPGIKSRMTAC